MLVFQFCIAAFFIVGGIIVNEQVQYMSNKKLGFSGNQVLTFYYGKSFDKYLTTKQELEKIPGVLEVSASGGSPGGGNRNSSNLDYKAKDKSIQSQNFPIDFNYLKMMKIEMAQGRSFLPQFTSDTANAVLINETAAKMLGLKNPLGNKACMEVFQKKNLP